MRKLLGVMGTSLPWLWWWFHGSMHMSNLSYVHLKNVHFIVCQTSLKKKKGITILTLLAMLFILPFWRSWDLEIPLLKCAFGHNLDVYLAQLHWLFIAQFYLTSSVSSLRQDLTLVTRRREGERACFSGRWTGYIVTVNLGSAPSLVMKLPSEFYAVTLPSLI